MKKCLVIISLVLLTGCATLGMIAEEARQIKTEDVRPYTDSLGVLLGDLVPAPYKMPAAIGVGYLLALVRRIYKRKKGSKA